MVTLLRLPFSRSVRQFLVERQRDKFIACSDWKFSRKRWDMVLFEGDDWECNYVPVDLKGKVVLDVGAGEGETARFFLAHGVRKVVCVECDEDRLRFLRVNALRHPEIEVIARRFFVGDLFRQDVDFIKVDIEGYEEMVLPYVLGVPAVFEVHGLQLVDRFRERGYRLSRHVGCDWWTCYAFWKC